MEASTRTIALTLSIVVAVLVALLGSMFLLDGRRGDKIADGVHVGPVDVSGLSRAQARERLRERLVDPLRDPLVIRALGRTYPLSAREAKLDVDVDAAVDDAVRRSREGGVLARTWRAIGGGLDARIAPRVSYSRGAVQRIADRIRVAVNRPAQDAAVNFSADALTIRRSRVGHAVDPRRLREQIAHALVTETGRRELRVKVKSTRPKISGDRLAGEYPVVLTVDRAGFRISLFKRLRRVKVYPIAVGQAGLETPPGLYKIQNKAIDPAWHVPNSAWAGDLAGRVIPGGAPDNPIKARWMGIYDGVGVHGTDARGSIGSNASHGCIRMLVEDVEALYEQVPVGTPIFIH